MLESLRESLTEIVFSCRVLSQAREATVAEVDGFIAGPLATALAEAEARGRRQGLEEAAKVADKEARDWPPKWTAAIAVGATAIAIRKLLATTPAETQKPETGEIVR